MKRLWYVLMLIISLALQAKFYAPEFEDQFAKWIKRHRLAIVHFNPFEMDADIPDLDRMKLAFKNLSDVPRYKDADVAFLGVNLTFLPDLVTLYNIKIPTAAEMKLVAKKDGAEDEKSIAKSGEIDIPKAEQATVILFKDGKPFKYHGNIVQRTGFLSKAQIRDFIETHFGELIDRILQEHQEEIREHHRQLQEQKHIIVQHPQRVEYVPKTTEYIYYPQRTYYRPYGGYWGRRGWGWGPGVGIGFGGRRGGFGIGFGW